MKRFGLSLIVSATTAAFLALGFAGAAHAAACNSPYVTGDVFDSVGNSTVDVFTPTGTLVCTLNDQIGSGTNGSGFDSSGNFYVTTFGSETVAKFDNSGNLVNSAFMQAGPHSNTPESIENITTGPFAGSSFVGGPGQNPPTINQFNTSTGMLIKSFTVAGGNGTGGTDWLTFISPTTAIYDGEGTAIKSFNFLTGHQNPDFGNDPHYGYAMSFIPSGTYAGYVLRADSTQATLLTPSGAIFRNYTLPGLSGNDFALALDSNGTDFWTADANTSNGTIWEVNIATGHIDEQFNCGGCPTGGLSVFGEPQVGTTPEPASLLLLGTGVLGVLGSIRRKLM
jgi:hypothetical protein